MKRLVLLMFGFSPFLIGGLINWYLMTYTHSVPPLNLICGFVYFMWFLASYFFRLTKTKATVAYLNAPAAVILILLAVQELGGAYWSNPLGLWTQFFYLPFMRAGFVMTPWSSRVLTGYCACFALMLVVSALGCRFRGNKNEG